MNTEISSSTDNVYQSFLINNASGQGSENKDKAVIIEKTHLSGMGEWEGEVQGEREDEREEAYVIMRTPIGARSHEDPAVYPVFANRD